jgi:hypothetical protein
MIIDYIFKLNKRRTFLGKKENQLVVPLTATKYESEDQDNDIILDFFPNSAYDRFNRNFQKSTSSYLISLFNIESFLFQRYVPCKGGNPTVLRCVSHKDKS